ncbi:MAG: dolichyl-phosphate beta-glucosyltransferase [Candidatus Omnitrophota bacterium]|nr:glycosyltransferase family 2 protein [Candidatus Omnitrophota bacterium]
MVENIFLSLIIPTYNEETNISDTLADVSGYLADKNFNYEVIVSDDGSKDATIKVVEGIKEKPRNLKIIRSEKNRGKGHALRSAVDAAVGEHIMFMDADSAVSISELDKFIPILTDNTDIYIASRRIPGAKLSMPANRNMLGKIYICLANILLGINVNDINCGFKVFKREAAKKVFSRQIMNDWSFDAELIFLSTKYGYKIGEVPIEWVYKDTSKVRPLRDGIKSFISLLKIRANDLRGKYD